MTRHELETTAATAIDVFTAAREPVLSVERGDTVTVRTLDCRGYLERQHSPGEDRPVLIEGNRGHCLVGPIAVTGAEPGDVLTVRLDRLEPHAWGFTAAGRGHTPLDERLGIREETALLWELDPVASVGRNQFGLGVALGPFLGVIGVPPEPTGEFSTIPPRAVGGGNIDCRELVAGSTLFLPVTVPGASLFVGDGHAAQGDGEVSGTAIECGMTTTMTLDIARSPALDTIHAVTPAGRITFGFDADLNEATAAALDAMLTWMEQLFGLSRSDTVALASVSVSMRVTQVANRTWGVHALLPHDAVLPAPPA